MLFTTKKLLGIVMILIGVVFFLFEFKALPHNPADPKKWDHLHAKYFRQIRMSGRIFLLLGLTFTVTEG
ncbi:MAG: hypothetical protein RBT69_07335 [Spirochaetia bacterium]|jgi:hypothetical protein|nr:hypothetical protein [Spirochaetia bacterium]